MTVTLAIIAKNEWQKLNSIIEKYSEYFDEIAVAYDDDIVTDHITLHPKLKLFKYDWCDDFAHKRNFLTDKITTDYYFRMDTDDEIQGAEMLPEAFRNYMQNEYTMVNMMYYYSFDKSGNCTAKHWRETFIKNDGSYRWNKAIHENILPTNPKKSHVGAEGKIGIVHRCSDEEHTKSAARNMRMLEAEYDTTKDKPDPRTVGYLARMYYAAKRYKDALEMFEKFIATSGWDDDKYFAWCQMCNCFLALAEGDKNSPILESALTCCNEALLLNPFFPDAYFLLMSVYHDMGKFKKALEWGELGFSKESPKTALVVDPTMYTWRPLCVMATCKLQSGHLDEALQLYKKAQNIAPHDKTIKTMMDFTKEIRRDNDVVNSYIKIMSFMKHDSAMVEKVCSTIPKALAHDERIVGMKQRILPPSTWDDKSVVIMCGDAWEDWVDTSVIGGIGGSEEAVIYMSRELTKLGYSVTVFNRCGELNGNYKGVTYKNWYEFNPKDEFNVLIMWRNNLYGDMEIKCNKRLVWLHDVPYKGMLDDTHFDKVFVLSNFHKSLLENVPEEKIVVTSNGINMDDFNHERVNDPKRVVYISSYDRGLENLLNIWKEVITQVPDAKLDIYYGWKTYDEMMRTGRRSPEFKNKMVELMDQPGVVEHGRIGHKKLAKVLCESGIWAYPTKFDEISCISAMKAQTAGTIPVCTNHAALAETVKYGVKVPGDIEKPHTLKEFQEKLIAMLKHPEKQEEIRSTINVDFSWANVAKQWSENEF